MQFAVYVRGQNFLVHFGPDPEPRRHGFLTIVEVEAPDMAAAETAAVQLLRRYQYLRDNVLNARDDPPRMFVERMGEYQEGPGQPPPLTVAPNLVWYPEDDTDGDV